LVNIDATGANLFFNRSRRFVRLQATAQNGEIEKSKKNGVAGSG